MGGWVEGGWVGVGRGRKIPVPSAGSNSSKSTARFKIVTPILVRRHLYLIFMDMDFDCILSFVH